MDVTKLLSDIRFKGTDAELDEVCHQTDQVFVRANDYWTDSHSKLLESKISGFKVSIIRCKEKPLPN